MNTPPTPRPAPEPQPGARQIHIDRLEVRLPNCTPQQARAAVTALSEQILRGLNESQLPGSASLTLTELQVQAAREEPIAQAVVRALLQRIER